MPEVLKNEERPQVIEATFSERQRSGEKIVRSFEGATYQFPAQPEKITGELAVRPAGVNLRTTAEASIDGFEGAYILPVGNSEYAIQMLESDPHNLLYRALAYGDHVNEQ